MHFKANVCQYSLIFERIFGQVYFKFLRRMMILLLASKCAISATTLFPISIFYRLHKMFLRKRTGNYSWFDKSYWIQLIYTWYRWNHCFFPDDNIPTSAAIFVYNGAFDIAFSVRNVRGALYYVIYSKYSDMHAKIL